MKKYGKYEKMPDGTKAKQPTVKSALLQTYFTSLLCLVLCVTMFMGTSYAWFTSEVTNTTNEIYVGTLKVGLYKDETSLANSDTKLFDSSIRWEPGYTALETIQVVNEGDLAFKYEMTFTEGTHGEANTKSVSEVAEYFDVWVFDHLNKEYAAPASYDAITEHPDWEKVGTLAEVLSGNVVLKGNMVTVRQDDNLSVTEPTNGVTDGVKTTDTYTIALHMSENAEPDVMGHKIGLNVRLIAYQMASEQDDFGNSNYDKTTKFVSTAEELKKALDEAEGETVIVLANNIDARYDNVTVTQKEGVKITIHGGGNSFYGSIYVDGKSSAYDSAALTIKNVGFAQVSGKGNAYIHLGTGDDSTRYTNHVTIKDCSFTSVGNETVAIKSYTGGDKNLTVDGCTVDSGMHSLLQVSNVETCLTVKNCVVKSKNGINLNYTPVLEMSNCTFDVSGYAVRVGVEGATVNGEYTISGSVLKSACNDGDAVIILRGTMSDSTLNLVNTELVGTLEITNASRATVNGQN